MRQFYLFKNKSGYYNAVLIDPVSGLRRTTKSTHCKDKVEATVIAAEWVKSGIPDARSNSRKFLAPVTYPTVNLKSVVSGLTENDVHVLTSLISDKFGVSLNVSTGASTPEPVQETVYTPAKPVLAKGEKKIKLAEYLINFWDYDKSEFIQRYIAKGKKLSRMHTEAMKGLAKNYWLTYFGEDKYIQDLDQDELEEFFFYLYSERKLKGSTVNHAITCGNRAMSYLYDRHKISVNPMAGIERYGTNGLKRGIPTESEVRELLNLDWKNDLGKLAFELAAYCGLRAGEISGLRVCDIDDVAEILHIRHSWNEMDGLKSTKNTDERDVPVSRELLLKLINRAKSNPNFSDTSYVFFSNVKPEIPCRPGYYQDSFYEAMSEIGISEEQRKERNIVFHSLRHFCATLLSQRTDIRTVQAILGHRSASMSIHYSDHETQEKLDNMRNVMASAWEKYLTA
ncbi:MAG: tyrosine-type recombinase/integrase [Treponema sp.]|nr:tyrosine-type recombinase/integrase [Treponema sp.]